MIQHPSIDRSHDLWLHVRTLNWRNTVSSWLLGLRHRRRHILAVQDRGRIYYFVTTTLITHKIFHCSKTKTCRFIFGYLISKSNLQLSCYCFRKGISRTYALQIRHLDKRAITPPQRFVKCELSQNLFIVDSHRAARDCCWCDDPSAWVFQINNGRRPAAWCNSCSVNESTWSGEGNRSKVGEWN